MFRSSLGAFLVFLPLIITVTRSLAQEAEVMVFGHEIRASHLENPVTPGTPPVKVLASLTQGFAFENYAKKKKLEPTDAEIKLALTNLKHIPAPSREQITSSADKYNQKLKEAGVEPEHRDAAASEIQNTAPMLQQQIQRFYVHALILNWKVGKDLYQQFGGRVVKSAYGNFLPLDGFAKIVTEAVEAGEIIIPDAKMKEDFLLEIANPSPHGPPLSNEEIQALYRTPPWL